MIEVAQDRETDGKARDEAEAQAVHEAVRDYYGTRLQDTSDLQTNACCTPASIPAELKPILAKIHTEVLDRYYGCGLIAPSALAGCRVLDLGSGSGRDVYVLSALVGSGGSVVGVDMTPEQLAVADRHRDYHAAQFGFDRSNVRFLEGNIERLEELPLEAGSFDIIISNCVLNLARDKAAVLRQAHRLLKPGGEMYFADVYADRRIPKPLAEDPVLYGECLGGALYWNDFLTIARAVGFMDPRLVEDRPLEIENPVLEALVEPVRFYSATYRLFKLDGLEPSCEDYGQAVVYKGGLAGHPHRFVLDRHHSIASGKVFPVCGNTWRMLHDTRFRPFFDFVGSWESHHGIFPGCGEALPFGEADSGVSGSCC